MTAQSTHLEARPEPWSTQEASYSKSRSTVCPSQQSKQAAHRISTVYDLPLELLVSLVDKNTGPQVLPEDAVEAEVPRESREAETVAKSQQQKACGQCDVIFSNFQEQRDHVRSDWHRYNLKRRLTGSKTVTQDEFEKLIEDLDESISGDSSSDSSGSEDEIHDTKGDHLSQLLRKQAAINNLNGEDEEHKPKRRKKSAGATPMIWFKSPLLSSNTSLGIYRTLFTAEELAEVSRIEILRRKQLAPVSAKVSGPNGALASATSSSPSIFMCMVGGGHFAGMIVSLAPKVSKHSSGTDQREANVLAHKTFHRYTTRRKQGGGQSANDNAKGAAHSAGSSLRRYNEVALEQDIRTLLGEWSKNPVRSIRRSGPSKQRSSKSVVSIQHTACYPIGADARFCRADASQGKRSR